MTAETSRGDFDPQKAEAFAEKMVGVLNDGALALLASIGHRTRLFDTMAILPLWLVLFGFS